MKSPNVQIDFADSRLLLTDKYQILKPYHQIQLSSVWGLSLIAPDTFARSLETPPSTLSKIITYLSEENIAVRLSKECAQAIADLKRNEKRFKDLKESVMAYKQGKIPGKEFLSFSKFASDHIPRKLKEHQLKAAYHLYLIKNGANFSVPGSGKTAVVLTTYEKLRLEGKVNLLLIVGPPACFGPWKWEFEQTLGRKPSVRVLAGGPRPLRKSEYFNPLSKRAELYLTTFQTLNHDEEQLGLFLSHSGTKTFMVVDEAHYIKQLGGSWASSILRLANRATFRCALTGTPFPRSYADTFNIFDYLWPSDPIISDKAKLRIQRAENEHDDSTASIEIRAAIAPIFYRVRKSDLHLIPPIFHSPYKIAMKPIERRIYDAIFHKIRDYAKQAYLRNIEIVESLRKARIMRLRQCVSYPGLLISGLDELYVDPNHRDDDLASYIRKYGDLELPAKLECLGQLVAGLNCNKQKVVVWANFIGTLDVIQKHLNNTKIKSKIIKGQTPTEQNTVELEETREKIIAEFLDIGSGLDVLIANPAACAESISLHRSCSHAIYYDLSYNCAQYLQSLDRIHRVGGSENKRSEYHFLECDNTIDQDIRANLDQKASRMYQIIDEDYEIYDLDMFGEQNEEVDAYNRLFGK
jgi:SNF2 family DNA or RNA helicase